MVFLGSERMTEHEVHILDNARKTITNVTTSALTRRRFLRTTVQAGAVAVAPAFIPSSAL